MPTWRNEADFDAAEKFLTDFVVDCNAPAVESGKVS